MSEHPQHHWIRVVSYGDAHEDHGMGDGATAEGGFHDLSDVIVGGNVVSLTAMQLRPTIFGTQVA